MLIVATSSACASAIESDFGFAMGGRLGLGRMGDVAGGGVGADITVRLRPANWHIGVRLEAGTSTLSGSQGSSQADICIPFIFCGTVSGTAQASHSVAWVGAGPEWHTPVDKHSFDVYALAGIVSMSPSIEGVTINVRGQDVPGSSSFAMCFGGSATIRLPEGARIPRHFKGQMGIEIGAELQVGGAGTFYSDPLLVPDGTGYYDIRTESARVSTLGFRVGIVWSQR